MLKRSQFSPHTATLLVVILLFFVAVVVVVFVVFVVGKKSFSRGLEFTHANEVSSGGLPDPPGQLGVQLRGQKSAVLSFGTVLWLTGTALEWGRTHEMQTRAPFLKTSAIDRIQSWLLKGLSVINSVRNWSQV